MSTSQVFVDPAAYADDARLKAAFAELRSNQPVVWVESDAFAPFWAITKHADVMEVSTRREVFNNSPRPVLTPRAVEERRAGGKAFRMRSLIHMDGEEHTTHRSLVAEWFLPKNVSRYEASLHDLATRYVDRLLDTHDCDFVSTVAERLPLHAIMTILGLPDSDHDHVLALTQRIFSVGDASRDDVDQADSFLRAFAEFNDYFRLVAEDRRRTPTGDLSSVIANARIDGELLDERECLSYFTLVASAGHDTTAGVLSGGLAALLQHPEQLARVRSDASVMPTAVEEMIRWVTPTKCFMRTAVADYELRGQQIRTGDSVLLSYASANFDEDQFDHPEIFDVTRSPNKHLAFGFGPHFCLGAQLARLEMRTLFTELLRRVGPIELAGEPELKPTVFVGGVKHLPITYRAA